ncbi:MAG: polysaccharide deacetylase family protein [Candidatus Hodarchaeota archaeon]
MSSPLSLCLCVDVDRDAPFPLSNYAHAISLPLHSEPQVHSDPVRSACYDATIAGLEEILTLVSNLAIKLTLFIEGRFALCNSDFIKAKKTDFLKHEIGLHGLDHEDFSGEDTGILISQPEQIILEGKKAIEDIFTTDIVSFRAPYMKKGVISSSLLQQLGFQYDSSDYVRLDSSLCLPVLKQQTALKEIPVIQLPKGEKFRGMVFYLWPLFEGNRSWSEYTSAIREICFANREGCEESSLPLSLNLHPWHLCYRVKDKRYLTKEEVSANVGALKKILEELVEIQTEGFIKIKKMNEVRF